MDFSWHNITDGRRENTDAFRIFYGFNKTAKIYKLVQDIQPSGKTPEY